MTDIAPTPVFDYFSQVDLPTPTLSDDEVQRLFADTFGGEIDVQALGSQQDQNFRVFARGSAEPLGVLKLSNPVFSEAEIEMQDAAAARVAERSPQVRIPRIVVGPRGAMSTWWESSQGRIHARVIENIAGRTLMGSGYLSPATVENMGALSAAVSLSLADFTHPASVRVLQWDLRHAERVIDTLLPLEPDAGVRAIVQRAADAARAALAPVRDRLPVQAGHFDVTDDNVLCAPGAAVPDAVIDFGDVCASWRVGEIAVTVSSVLHHDDATPETAFPAIRAFDQVRDLTDDELTALWPLVILRGAVLVLSGRAQVRLDDENEYASVALDREFRILEQAASVPIPVITAATRAALGRSRSEEPAWTGAPVLSLGRHVELDAATESPLNDEGAWLDASTLDDAAMAAIDAGADVVTVPAWRARLTGTTDPLPSTPETVPTDVLVWLAAPADADDALVWTVGAESVTTLPARTRLSARRPLDAHVPPRRTTRALADAWREVAGDPGAVIGVPAAAPTPDDLLDRRHEVLAEVQEHYYAAPPRIERGWREHLVDVDGRVYLDMVNNVASVGHAHPRVVEAGSRQMHLLNTNSRFHYRAITDFADRIAATLPDGFDTVFFVNSGSEATDLAIRLAMAATGRPDIVAMREAYHGWTYASDAVSTSIADNPNALSTRPAWVHTVDAANSYRGKYRGADAVKYAPEAVAVIDELAASGRPPAGMIAETYFGNAGGVALPDGYLTEVYAAIRRHGGLAIADEVQVGYGRLGEWFWGFEQQGAVPDIVAVAKSIGGGHPLGAVITRREVADRYRTQGYFFSSTGGSPVSSAIGMAVLDVIEQEGLQENARVVGGHLKRRLEKLGEKHDLIGTVHGSGLYLGVEFVRDRETLEPATAETAAICDRLLERGVIMQPTGDFQNVLKIKPPLVVTQASVDVFVDALDHVLTTGF
ncbi:aminotransferase class III-fold pyridoxal phosphate-dependent enzyme [Microbacterium sp. KSW2-21]|uniref:Aminotransferase class III-fold pyridoxal phosphate-dependent enzyme n=1 Tax=Microbacterium algihabitans TaxID=3075992 RepID=A0ABU3RTG1_9MICO|nr:aminotransferase class III-fold pyridoxal phosphate-dependent enzyme [Microbacterium sp. KSW2-21]MDU0325865.1 aminotransferase class III-fold pyridoxal phosphate-dependent enzyme [Microbacterium sp. KSW2-21]